MHRLLSLALCAGFAPALCAQYTSDFESLTASSTGTLLTGQDGWYLPVAGSADWKVYTYAGNPFGMVANPNGGNNFIAGVAASTTVFARCQRANTFDNLSTWRLTFDVNCMYTGTGTPVNNIGSGSTQPSTSAAYINCLARWPTGGTGTTWNADFVYFTAANVSTTGSLPDPSFQGLMTNHWYTWTIEWNYTTNRIMAIAMKDLTGSLDARFEPADWYMFGGATGPFPPLPTDFRFFTGGDNFNVFAVDNVYLLPQMYAPYGRGCAGTAGTPALDAAPGSLPQLGSSFQILVSNMPTTGAGLVTTGFSDSAYGSVPLPLDLGLFGAPGCTVLTSPDARSLVLSSGGVAGLTLPIPNTASLAGVGFFNQALVIDVPANGLGLTSSNARRGWIR